MFPLLNDYMYLRDVISTHSSTASTAWNAESRWRCEWDMIEEPWMRTRPSRRLSYNEHDAYGNIFNSPPSVYPVILDQVLGKSRTNSIGVDNRFDPTGPKIRMSRTQSYSEYLTKYLSQRYICRLTTYGKNPTNEYSSRLVILSWSLSRQPCLVRS